MTKIDDFFQKGRRKAEREALDADMRPRDIVDVLRRLKFDEHYCSLWIDRCAII